MVGKEIRMGRLFSGKKAVIVAADHGLTWDLLKA